MTASATGVFAKSMWPSTGGVSDIPGPEAPPPYRLGISAWSCGSPAGSQVRIWPALASAVGIIRTIRQAVEAPGRPPRRAGVYAGVPRDSIIDLATVLDIRVYGSQGRLRWDAPAGNWTILRMDTLPPAGTTAPLPTADWASTAISTRAGIDFHFHYMFDKILPMLRPLVARGWRDP